MGRVSPRLEGRPVLPGTRRSARLPSMGPRDRLRARLGGSTCAACGAAVRGDAVRVLAQRDEIVFLGLTCPACGSESLAIETLPSAGGGLLRSTDGPTFGEFVPVDEVRFSGARPIDGDDVLAVHRFLADYDGPLGGLLADGSARPALALAVDGPPDLGSRAG